MFLPVDFWCILRCSPYRAIYVKDSGLLGYCRIFERANDIAGWGTAQVGFILFLLFLLFLYTRVQEWRETETSPHNPTDDLEPRGKERREGRKQEGKGDP